jgi:uncharacterized protein (TIGR02722 family)
MKSVRFILTVIAISLFVFSFGCAQKKVVSRIPADSETDLSGRWNDTDSRLVSEQMISNCLMHQWKSQHMMATTKKPVVIVGVIRNKSSEHIAVGTFIGDIEKAFINSGEVTIVASPEEREQVRDERDDQQTYSSEETMKKWGRERGADYMMGGVINSIIDEEGGEKIIYYQIDLNLINLEDNTKVWTEQKKIKKYIGRQKYSY